MIHAILFFSFQRLSMCRLGLGFQLVHRCSIHHVASSINNKDWLFCNCSSASYGACWCWGPLQTYNGKIITRYGQCNMHRWLSTVPPPGNLLKLTGRMIFFCYWDKCDWIKFVAVNVERIWLPAWAKITLQDMVAWKYRQHICLVEWHYMSISYHICMVLKSHNNTHHYAFTLLIALLNFNVSNYWVFRHLQVK